MRLSREQCAAYLTNDQVLAFLRVIREGESAQDDSAYRAIVGGGYYEKPSLAEHPRIAVQTKWGWSSAFGAYQIMAAVPGKVKTDTYDWISKWVGPSMEKFDQDVKAVFLIHHRGALDDVLAGRIDSALKKCGKEWASLPGSPYGQHTITRERALATFEKYGGRLEESNNSGRTETPEQPPKIEAKPMAIPVVIPAILSALASLLPALKGLGFGSGSEVANRNLGAGVLVAEKIVEVTNAVNLQEAASKIESDPAALAAAKDAVDEVVKGLNEMGGGVAEARKVASDPNQIPFYKNPAFIIAMVLTPLIYMVAVELLFNPSGQTWSDDIKMMFVTAIVSGLLGSVTGFFLGSSFGSQKKDERKA